jgi:hypothetical protein
MGFAAISSYIIMQNAFAVEQSDPRNDLYPVKENREFNLEEFDIKGGLRKLTEENSVTSYNNYY